MNLIPLLEIRYQKQGTKHQGQKKKDNQEDSGIFEGDYFIFLFMDIFLILGGGIFFGMLNKINKNLFFYMRKGKNFYFSGSFLFDIILDFKF